MTERHAIHWTSAVLLVLTTYACTSDPINPPQAGVAAAVSGGPLAARDEVRTTATQPAPRAASLPADAQAVWARLRTVEADGPPKSWARGTDPERNTYWSEVLLQAHSVLWNFLKSKPAEESLRALLDQFGREGAQADFRLLFSDPYLMLPQRSESVMGARMHGISEPRLRRLRASVCKAQVEILSRDMDRLRRYYRAVLWNGHWLRADKTSRLPGAVVLTRKGFDLGTEEEHICSVRNFLVLAAATDRLDLVKGRPLSNFKQAWETWLKWYNDPKIVFKFDKDSLTWKPARRKCAPGERRDLRGVPPEPFVDWCGPPAPPQPGMWTLGLIEYTYGWEHRNRFPKPARPTPPGRSVEPPPATESDNLAPK